MKFIYTLLIVFLPSVYAQAQTVEKKNSIDFSSLSSIQESPKYEVTVTAETPFRVFINDIPLLSSEKLGTIKIPINSAIASSGPQHISVLKQKKNAQSKQLDIAISVSGQTASLWKSDLKGKNKVTGEFEATVPYNIYDWSKSTIIKVDDSAKMEQAKLWFNQMAEFLKSGNGEDFMKRLYPAEQNIFQANYIDKAFALGYHDGWKDYINKVGLKVADLKTSRVEIVGNGKLLHLVNHIGEGALGILNGKRKTIFDIFLHYPKGENEPKAILFNLIEY